jgi:hypothetical protein
MLARIECAGSADEDLRGRYRAFYLDMETIRDRYFSGASSSSLNKSEMMSF